MAPLLTRLGVGGGNGGFGFGKRRPALSTGPVIKASGGNQTPANGLAPGNGYVYHTFTSTGPSTFTVLSPTLTSVELLMIGGGGAAHSGGGGAGALIYRTSVPVSVSPGVYPVSVGAGGPNASLPANSPAPNGSDSTALGFTAAGGGGGGVQANPYTTRNGNPGGSGGGAGGDGGGSHSGGTASGAPGGTNGSQSPPLGWGNPGGNDGSGAVGGSGGGAGGGGSTGTAGGPGLTYSNFTGTLIGVPALDPLSGTFGGGGADGGSGPLPASPGGGGAGGAVNPGITNSGGGGGGPAGAGGPGIIVIRYLA